VLELFHYALNPGGFLFLGKSENLGACSALFEPVSASWRIFRSLRVHSRRNRQLPPRLDFQPHFPASTPREDDPPLRALGAIAQRALLERHTPAAVLVHPANHRALYFHGRTERYLSQPRGEADWDITGLVRDGLRIKLRAALHQADREDVLVRVDARMDRGDEQSRVRIEIAPLRIDGQERLHLVTFEDIPEPRSTAPLVDDVSLDEPSVMKRLELELLETRRELQSAVEDLETSNEELRVTNEEALSMNEELQSSNEELETSKEELQSVNEELSTVNHQLEEKLHEIEQANDDLNNLLVSTHIPTLFLDRQLRIQRYTPAATSVFRLIPSDLHRPVQDIKSRVEDDTLLSDAHSELETGATREVEIRDG
jgi:two-component system CheB/CheR fusion protein